MTLISFKIPHQTSFICRYGGELPDRSTDNSSANDFDRDGHDFRAPDFLPARLLPGYSYECYPSSHSVVSVEPQDQRDAASEDNKTSEGILWIQGKNCCLLVGSDGVLEEDLRHDLLLRAKPWTLQSPEPLARRASPIWC